MKAEKPATSISKTAEFKDSVCYRIECDCLSENHRVDTWIEVDQPYSDFKMVSIRFHVNTYTHPFSHGFWQRVKNACKVLMGVDEQQHEILLKPQAAKNWVNAVNSTIKTLGKTK
jgi:hypothetical protein